MKVNFPFLLLSPFSQQLQLAAGHGALMSPTTRRGNTGYENDPVSSITGNDMVCRHGAPNTNVPLVAKAAGSTLDLMWDFGAAHVGDCAVFISYDISANRADQKYFKIANLPDCRAQNKQAVTITLPDFLPAGQAVLRWDWSALHTWPSVEFYSQCIDLQISSSANSVAISSINTYSIISPAIYPRNGKSGVGFRCPFNPNTEQYMTGTACARSYTGNNCDLTKAGTTGNTGGGGEDPGGGGGDDGGGGDMTPICDVYVVKAGDTLSAIANIYIAQGVSVTWQEICQFNGISNSCDAIEVGDTYTIPGTCVIPEDGEEDPDDENWNKGGSYVWAYLLAGAVFGGVFFIKWNEKRQKTSVLTVTKRGSKQHGTTIKKQKLQMKNMV